jgi:hypothetical protein
MILSLVFNIMVVNLNLFPCLTGVRQIEHLYPFLFSIFLNELEDFFRQLEPLKIIQEKLENELHIFYIFFVILYATNQ